MKPADARAQDNAKGAQADELRVRFQDGGVALESDARLALLSALLEAGHPVARRSAAGYSPDVPVLAVLAEEAAESEPVPRFALTDLEPDALPGRLEALRDARSLDAPGEWTPWFPVIDYSRCTNCMQCLSFCLFDVYGVDSDGKIEVRNEEKCKTNCPACSRVCPDVAILFPKYTKGPINGDKVTEQDVQKESMKVDISALLGGDIYSSLRDRADGARKRFSTERDASKALLERKRCLKELKDNLDIPNEVLMSLPSAGEIAERAERAKAKAERRRAASQSVKDATTRPAPTETEWGI